MQVQNLRHILSHLGFHNYCGLGAEINIMHHGVTRVILFRGYAEVGGGVVCISAAGAQCPDHYTCNLPACDPLLPTLLLGGALS